MASLRRTTRTACRNESWSGSVIRFERGLVHQTANGKVRHHQAVELLADQVWGFTAQDDLGAAQVGLQFGQGGFDLPALVIEGGEFGRPALARDRA